MSRAASRSASNSGSFARALARLSMKPVFTCFIAFCSVWLASAARALSLKAWEVLSMASGAPPRRLPRRLAVRRLTDGGMIRHARQHLGNVAHLDVRAPPLQLAGPVHEAAEVAGQQLGRAAWRERVGPYV